MGQNSLGLLIKTDSFNIKNMLSLRFACDLIISINVYQTHPPLVKLKDVLVFIKSKYNPLKMNGEIIN